MSYIYITDIYIYCIHNIIYIEHYIYVLDIYNVLNSVAVRKVKLLISMDLESDRLFKGNSLFRQV